MAQSITRTPLCTVDWCAHPTDPDWHKCIVCGAPAVQHAHVESRALNPSRRKDKANQVMLCRAHHAEVDLRQNGVHGHAIRRIPGRGRLYFRWDLHGNTVFQKILTCEGDEQLTAGRNSGPDSVSLSPSQAAGDSAVISETGGGTAPAVLMDAGVVRLPSFTPSTPASSLCQEGMQLLYWGLRIKGATDEWRWAVGDLILRMEEVYNESAYQFLEPLKEAFGYDALRQYRMVAAGVTQVTRELAPTWSHARIVATLDESDQRAALITARDEHLTSRETAILVRPEPAERERHTCSCGNVHWLEVKGEWK